ncbi:lysophospholipid acyltransferase family protein [Mangrovibacterium sp.]|uniref:lysophospholipid acyltransferase family protein n=1 Tax=Mangrovibacterium sp. TaxID=1961364 RepID=UPI003566E423
MLTAKHNFLIYPFFQKYAGWIINRHFGTVQIIGHLNKKELPILLISNHISWWDGFWGMYVNSNVLHRKFHFMMLEEQLQKYWLLRYTGGFSVNKKSKSMVDTLNYSAKLLHDRQNMLLIFPQGEIQSLHNQTFHFEKGVERIVKDKQNAVQIVFMANLIDYFSNRKPGIFIHLQEYESNAFDINSIQESYNLFYARSVERQKNSTGNK